MTLILLAAGLGSRYGGLKQLEPVGPAGETLMDYSIFDARRAGFDRVIFIIRRDFEDAFRAAVLSKYAATGLCFELAFQSHDDLPAPFTRPAERQKPWGTAHALLAARDLLDAPFVVINADDFYGLESFQNHALFFNSTGRNRFAMAGYQLADTLSPHGTVARGVCKAGDKNQLLSIREHHKIRALEGACPHAPQAEDIADPANPVRFTGREPVSLNNWAFTPEAIPLLSDYFADWLADHHADLKAECYLPSAVDHFIANGLATVTVLPTRGPWFGVTYKEDLPAVQSQIAALHAAGHYPPVLWE